MFQQSRVLRHAYHWLDDDVRERHQGVRVHDRRVQSETVIWA
jgi:hypothetical protein